MTRQSRPTPREAAALEEIRKQIAKHYPGAMFELQRGEEPPGWYLETIVDIDDTEEVYNLVADRLFEMQVNEGLRVYAAPVRTPERIAAHLRELRELLTTQASAKLT